MAATKKTAKAKVAAALPVSTAAFKHGASAYGARFVKKGFGFSEQEDLEWALGWPHVRRLVDGHPDDADPLSVRGTAFPRYDLDFPREQAARRVRQYLFCPTTGDEARNTWWELAAKHVETPGPITEEETRTVILQHLKPVADPWWWAFLPQIILLCEAFVGPQPVAEALVLSDSYTSPWTTVTSPHPEARRSTVTMVPESGPCGGEDDGRAGEEADGRDNEARPYRPRSVASRRGSEDRAEVRTERQAALGAGRAA